MFLRKNGISEKIEAHFPKLPRKKEASRISIIAQLHLLVLFKFFSPTTTKIAKERINMLPFYLTDMLFTELQIHNVCEKKICEKWYN